MDGSYRVNHCHFVVWSVWDYGGSYHAARPLPTFNPVSDRSRCWNPDRRCTSSLVATCFLAKLNEDSDGDHGHGHDHHQHQNAVWLGFTALTSMIGFFVFEKIVNVIGEMREKHHDDRKLRVVREGHIASDKAVGDAVCKNKYSNYCASELDQLESEGMVKQSNTATSLVEDGVIDHRDTVIISQHEVLHHGHSHAHHHSHSAPHNISSVAWMVIFGDGIHNLADGLAIGAAFADGYMSGFSTSLAVLCHELPHEIGDFAMLLKAGMTIKQAVFYNVLSSVLAFIGMVIGLLLGTIHNFSSWMFTATAGIFLYVALVDMMPEHCHGGHLLVRRLGRHDAGALLGPLPSNLLQQAKGGSLVESHTPGIGNVYWSFHNACHCTLRG